METTNESYQNLTQTQRDLKIEKLYSIIEKAQLLELKGKISSTRFITLFNLYMNKITFLYSLPIIINEIEIQNRNKVTPTTTPTTTEDKTNLQIIKTQIEQSFKKISRNSLIFKYACFLRTIKKITSKELLLISYINKEKLDSLNRVHSLLVCEHARLYKVAKNSLLSI